ncbi:hypothetical protein U1Q18_023372 [Sarracenia purpurea var. burkii]
MLRLLSSCDSVRVISESRSLVRAISESQSLVLWFSWFVVFRGSLWSSSLGVWHLVPSGSWFATVVAVVAD